jgi:hypothetical protein
MKIDAVSIATATLLTRLLLRLEREGIVTPNFIDELMNDAVGASQDAGYPANDEAAEFLHEVWADLNRNRDFSAS